MAGGRRATGKASAARRAEPIIDLHIHINPWHRLNTAARAVLEHSQPHYDQIREYIEDASALVGLMDSQRIEKAGLINYVAPKVMGYKQDINAWVHEYVKGHEDRLIPFGGMDAHFEGNPKREIEKLLFKYELKGIKVHPPHALVYPNDYKVGHGALEKLYQMCQDESVPVMFHTGTSIFPTARSKYGDPMHLDDVAIDFPRLKIIMAHGGRPIWMDTAFFLLRRHKNMYLDISSIPPKRLLDYFPRLESVADKAIFGSDWPGPDVVSMRHNADAVDALPLSKDARRKILYYNAIKVLG